MFKTKNGKVKTSLSSSYIMANEGDLVDEENGENMEEEICDGRGKKRVYEPRNSGRCSKVASKKKYSKKRKFHGNQNTTKLNQKLKK